jgi:ATP-binding cassette, subfamily B, multidrug efflux pump
MNAQPARSSRSPRMAMGPGGGPPGAGAPPQKAKDAGKTLRTLAQRLSPYGISITVVMLFALASTVFSIVGPKMMGNVTTKLVEGLIAWYTGTGLLTDMAYITRILTWLAALYVISSACSYVQGYIMAGVANNVTFRMRREISEKINRLPLKYFDKLTHGEVLSRITNDVDLVNQTLNQSLTQLVTSIVTVLGVLVMMLSISWQMTILALLVLPVSGVAMMFIIKRSQGYFVAQQKYLGSLNGQIEEMYGGHTIVQAFNGEAAAVASFEENNEALRGTAAKSQFMSSIMMPVMACIGNFGYVAVCVMGGYLAVKKVVEIGDIQSFIQYMRSFTQPIAQLASISNTIQSTVAAAERVFEFLDEPEESADPSTIEDASLASTKGEVRFDHVSFGYDPEKIIIKDFSALAKPGQKVAIVGPTGAGKTTIVKLLMRFYELNGGRIEIDGRDIHDFSRAQLRSLFGMVLQDTWLYNASVMENLRYGSFEATDEQVVKAAKAAHCDEFIRALPGGYDMMMNEESTNISQGQKQLFTIARSILANPRILILDEATSSVDTRTEILIQKAMDVLMRGRTSFVIAHRLSTIKNADLILVMRDGDVVEQGTHEQLLKANGFYADLYNSQFDE